MRILAGWLTFAVAIALTVLLAFLAYGLASQAWEGVVGYKSPYLESSLPAASAGEPMASRVVLVIVDGLRLDASRRMASLEALRDYGAGFVLTAPQPSLSYPNWTTILSGTDQDVHGVVTNWHEGPASAETLLDTAVRVGMPYVVVGPSDIATMFPAATRATASYFMEWSKEYRSDRYVTEALRLVGLHDPRLVVVHLPDIDEAGHDFGGGSDAYLEVVSRVDQDLRTLVEGLQDTRTAFVIVSDHGHIDTGGHGGWESEVVEVPGVFAGAGVSVFDGQGSLVDVAPTVAVLAGIPAPRNGTGRVIESALSAAPADALDAAGAQRIAAVDSYVKLLAGSADGGAVLPRDAGSDDLTTYYAAARDKRLENERSERLRGTGPALVAAAAVVLLCIGIVSWRALTAMLVGALAYHGLYNALFFLLLGNHWSLSAFNSEDRIDAWMNGRLLEAAVAGVVAVAVAAMVYPYLRHAPVGPHGVYLPRWLALGPLTVLVTQLTLAVMVGWFLWAWGLIPEWRMPDLMWGFKFDLDLIQTTALGASAILAPLVSYLVGRFHPRTVRTAHEEAS